MQYKVLFHAVIEGKKHNLDAVFESINEPKLTDIAVVKAAMQALSEIIDISDPVFSVEFHLEAIQPVT